jgi:hypothetical protein
LVCWFGGSQLRFDLADHHLQFADRFGEVGGVGRVRYRMSCLQELEAIALPASQSLAVPVSAVDVVDSDADTTIAAETVGVLPFVILPRKRKRFLRRVGFKLFPLTIVVYGPVGVLLCYLAYDVVVSLGDSEEGFGGGVSLFDGIGRIRLRPFTYGGPRLRVVSGVSFLAY